MPISELAQLCERARIPVALTLLGKGAISEHHPMCVGMMGMHGGAEVNHAIQEADLLLALGMRFDDRVTGNLATYARGSRKIHVDIDPSEINKNVRVDVGIVGDLREVLRQLLDRVERRPNEAWFDRIAEWRADSELREIVRPADGPQHPAVPEGSCSAPRSSAICSSSRAATPSPSRTSASTRCGKPSTTSTSAPTA